MPGRRKVHALLAWTTPSSRRSPRPPRPREEDEAPDVGAGFTRTPSPATTGPVRVASLETQAFAVPQQAGGRRASPGRSRRDAARIPGHGMERRQGAGQVAGRSPGPARALQRHTPRTAPEGRRGRSRSGTSSLGPARASGPGGSAARRRSPETSRRLAPKTVIRPLAVRARRACKAPSAGGGPGPRGPPDGASQFGLQPPVGELVNHVPVHDQETPRPGAVRAGGRRRPPCPGSRARRRTIELQARSPGLGRPRTA